ncbi:MAG: hypothetical protein ACJAVK_001306 [Akkermansiaceae bacterium]|jgi:hypothetical protein
MQVSGGGESRPAIPVVTMIDVNGTQDAAESKEEATLRGVKSVVAWNSLATTSGSQEGRIFG